MLHVEDTYDISGSRIFVSGVGTQMMIASTLERPVNLSVAENLVAAASNRMENPDPWTLERIYHMFPEIARRSKLMATQLSGGEQQMLAIGRALMTNPKLLILDEPTEGIQPNIVHHIGDVIKQLNEEENITVLLVEQKLPFARRVGHVFSILDRGRSVASGKMSELDETLVQKYLTV
mgnify:CR=1 FL=1